jgi:hypothetical protein
MLANGKIMGIEYFDLLHHISTRILNPLATETRTSIFLFLQLLKQEHGQEWRRTRPLANDSKERQRHVCSFLLPMLIPSSAEITNGLSENKVEPDAVVWDRRIMLISFLYYETDDHRIILCPHPRKSALYPKRPWANAL